MKNFIARERDLVKTDDELVSLEKTRYLTWDESRDRVFVSTSLSCPAGCSFCYVPSFTLEQRSSRVSFGAVLSSIVIRDPRFRRGQRGTAIMFGGFSDPLLNNNIDTTLEAINILGADGNIIHLATRFTFGPSLSDMTSMGRNIIINYSISTFRRDIELGNQGCRFAEAENLVASGIPVALYVRPVLPNVTILDVPKMISLSKKAGIGYVTVGGLYVDNRISSRLSGVGVKLGEKTFLDKHFVLDTDYTLQKVRNNDSDRVVEEFQEAGFEVFLSSYHLIDSLRSTWKWPVST